MMRRMEVDRIDKVVLAGAFGSYINKVKAMAMGLIPDCALKNTYAVGNAAGDGARIALLNTDKRAEADRVARQVEYVELTVEEDFEKQFAAAMHFPHMKDKFPHLQKMHDKAARDRSLRLLRTLSAFAELPSAALLPLGAAAEEVRFRKNKIVFEAGSRSTVLYVVKEGEVRLSLGGDDAAANAREVKPGELLDGAAIARGDLHAVTATATALNTRLLAIPVDAVRALIAKEPDVGDKLTTS
jgi:hypothetical protein